MAFLVLAYPELSEVHFEQIQSFRKLNDVQFFNIVEPHFTIVFPVFDMAQDVFVNEVRNKLKGVAKIEFVIRCATISKDSFSNFFHTFLVPDEGFSRIVKLHDILYSNKLKENLRLDIDYIPHIGIGNVTDKYLCKQMADNWNSKEFSIPGIISKITIVNFENEIVNKIEEIELC